MKAIEPQVGKAGFDVGDSKPKRKHHDDQKRSCPVQAAGDAAKAFWRVGSAHRLFRLDPSGDNDAYLIIDHVGPAGRTKVAAIDLSGQANG